MAGPRRWRLRYLAPVRTFVGLNAVWKMPARTCLSAARRFPVALSHGSMASDMLKRLVNVCVRSAGPAQKRFRGKSKSKPRPKHHAKQNSGQHNRPGFLADPPKSPFAVGPTLAQARLGPPDHLTPETASKYFEAHVTQWAKSTRTLARYQNFGFAPMDMVPVLAAFAEAGSSGFFSTPENQVKYQLARLAEKPSSPQWAPIARQFEAEITFSTIFFSWCRHTSDSSILDKLASEGKIKLELLESLRHLATVAVRRPAEEFPFTRRIQRKVIMHVGPTNSGKTHHALRALAAAKTGVYAGPLRLLAHEIWERLNLGQIVPLGVEQPPPNANPQPSSNPHQAAALYTAPKDSRPTTTSAYARATNMLTGEEKKIVEHYAGLLSCTVEMLSPRMEYDVGVIDEIQMIGDAQRGFAWTAAVLGLSARELHLCGEASAIPIVRSLLQETGDDLEIREYKRLTPLLVEEQSLGGDLGKIQKGDCVIAFSRTSIFALKSEIERKSGLKCAVVYGKLPPEVRSEQAALFNDPDSGFDVIIGSDAIGMGLNLKIRRIIFSAVSKGDGGVGSRVPLSISQTKQIAGRAGRYGQSIDPSNSCGYVTTLYAKDLPFLKDALSHPSTPTITHAYVGPTTESMEAFCAALPVYKSRSNNSLFPTSNNQTSFLESIQMAHVYTSSLPPTYKYINTTSPSALEKLSKMCSWIEKHSKGVLTWEDKTCWLVSPMAWRDDWCMKCYEVILRRQRDDLDVGDIKAVLDETSKFMYGNEKKIPAAEMEMEPRGLMQVLEWAEEQMRRHSESLRAVAALEKEESSVDEGPREESSSQPAPRNRKPFIPEITSSTLSVLESFHKILVFYMWMLFRNSVVFSDQETTEELKRRVEVVLDWALQVIGNSNRDKTDGTDEKGKKAREERMLGEREAYKQLMKDYRERSAQHQREPKREGRDSEKLVWSDLNRVREEGSVSKRATVGVLDQAEIKSKGKRPWLQPPDLSTLLKSYVENPSLRVGRGGAAASKSVS